MPPKKRERGKPARRRPQLPVVIPVTICRNTIPFCDMTTMSGTWGDDKIEMSLDAFGTLWLRWHRPGGCEIFGIKQNDIIQAVFNKHVASKLVDMADQMEGKRSAARTPRKEST